MTQEEKRALERELLEKYNINVHFTENSTEKYDENKVYFAKKLAKANALLSRIRLPEELLSKPLLVANS